MDDNGQRENGRHKSGHPQWMMPQHQIKDSYTMKLMTVMAERDAAIQERNLFIAEKKAALSERDKAYLQRDAAISEWNAAVLERDEFFAALANETTMHNGNSGTVCAGSTASRGVKHVYHHNQQQQRISYDQPSESPPSDGPYENASDMHMSEAFPLSVAPQSTNKALLSKRSKKDSKGGETPPNKAKKPPKKKKKGGGEDLLKQASVTKNNEWKGQDLGLNQVAFDDSTMPAPGCSCTGEFHQCYKWGSGGWQSSCCTTTLSMHPLPVMPNRRHARIGGRKMSGSAFNKLISRLAAEGYDLSAAVDLKEHWAKHGTNRYITIK